ncbi:substrate-binding domain-containing protein [Alloiococcus sp. CFN-8]|uniref:substrate-binding domain-containing protein n=1 Tax=Alloiococcus sp. CFN-8 TaxID=3416081 RepID=UPI003CF7CCAA
MKLNKLIKAAIALSAATTVLVGCSGGSEGFDSSEYISVISREDGSGTRGAFVELMGIEEKQQDGTKTDRTTEEAIITSKTDVMLTNVSGDEYAIGYVSLGSLNDTVKSLKIDGVEASSENIKNGSYAVSRPFNIAVKEDISEVAQDFIDFILSAEGQAVVSDSYIAVDDAAEAYSGSKPEGKVVVAGSSSVSPVMEKLKEAYEEINTNATIEIQTSDSTAGMTGAMDGTCDIGMASRELKDSELKSLTPITIAMDGIAVIINNENPLEDISTEAVKNIYVGETTTWDEVE